MVRILLMSIFFACLAAQAQSDCPDVKSAQGALVGPLRVFNTAQVEYFSQNHRFADAKELLASEGVARRAAMAYAHPAPNSAAIGTPTDPIPGYDVRVTTTSDGKSYTILATKKSPPCSFAGAATDDRGVIYFMEALH